LSEEPVIYFSTARQSGDCEAGAMVWVLLRAWCVGYYGLFYGAVCSSNCI